MCYSSSFLLKRKTFLIRFCLCSPIVMTNQSNIWCRILYIGTYYYMFLSRFVNWFNWFLFNFMIQIKSNLDTSKKKNRIIHFKTIYSRTFSDFYVKKKNTRVRKLLTQFLLFFLFISLCWMLNIVFTTTTNKNSCITIFFLSMLLK